MNTIAITGRLTADPELTKLDRTEVCNMRIAENGSDRNPMFVDVAVFGPSASVCATHLSKGRLVAVGGRLRHREWEAPDGSKRSRHSIVAHRVDFLGPKPNGNHPGNGNGPSKKSPETQAKLDGEAMEPVGAKA